ncbi:MAG: acyloxyacyl hydrolase [Giesbergeria sp.]|nr:acyloxyacyl hydrolase [Giesbergeria sp.]
MRCTILYISPTRRLRPNSSHSPWFFERGIGTRFDFASHLAVGYNHGAAHQHEWQLRIQHSSPDGTKNPNPGQNYLQLRYARHF